MQFMTRMGAEQQFKSIFTAILIACTAFACGGGRQNEKGQSNGAVDRGGLTEVSVKTPIVGDFSLKDVDGKLHTLSDYLGKNIIVVNYFATWCEPCRKELVELEKIYQAYKNRGVLILAVAMDLPETRSEVRPLVKKQGFTFPVLLDVDLKAADLFNPKREAPFGLVIDFEKNQIWSHMGYVPGDEKTLEGIILSALQRAPDDTLPDAPAAGEWTTDGDER